jgi:hypothetical protein
MSLALATAHAADKNEDDYDRLDGHSKSGKKVNVIEWEGNLEIHVYPAGSLKGLALKLDDRNKKKPVMVIGYRFKDNPGEQLIRRAILGIEMPAKFNTYRDPREHEFDKIIISGNGLSGGVVAYNLEPEPTQLYPEGHPALAQQKPEAEKREPAAAGREKQLVPRFDEESGAIQPFFMEAREAKPSSADRAERMMNRR